MLERKLKNQRSEGKTVCGFSIRLILKGIMTFQVKESMDFEKRNNNNKKRNRKWKIPHTVLER